MANTYQQRAQHRKMIYAVLIMGLFTAALVHRNFVVYAQANQMQLRELTRGEVELTSSVLRHTLSGLNGLGVTILWSAAIEKQRKHEWNELELLIGSITRLQPYFITPWRFQGWNLAFNVSVECDRPIDKYYYISRGLTLLAHGERRNQGTPDLSQAGFPGNPDLRFDIGFFYQLKMGTSDDKYTMRCLLDLSCIDPVERRPPPGGLDGDTPTKDLSDWLTKFCHNHPTLCRRIIEKLHQRDKPGKFLEFLEDNKDVPSRFDVKKVANVKQANFTPRKEPFEQFPILPKAEESSWPNPEADVLTNEVMSVYLISRTWFQYAEKPLMPPENPYDRVVDPKKRVVTQFDATKYRKSKMPEIHVRGSPCRSQSYIAETLEEEGWFDDEGWTPPAVFIPNVGRVGQHERYMAGPRWDKAYVMYFKYGTENGMNFTDEQMAKLEELDAKFRLKFGAADDQEMQFVRQEVLLSEEYHAHLAKRDYIRNRQLTNYPAHLYTAKAESTREAVMAHKLYYEADQARKNLLSSARYFRLVHQANYIWMDLLLKNPQFAQVPSTQENTYDSQLKYMAASMREPDVAANYTDIILLGFEAMPSNCWAGQPPWLRWASGVDKGGDRLNPKRLLLTDEDLNKLIPMRKSKAIYTGIRGAFEIMQYYDSPRTPALKDALMLWTAGASLPTCPLEFFSAGLNPAHRMALMTASPLGVYTVNPPPASALTGESWRFLVEQTAVNTIRGRYNIK